MQATYDLLRRQSPMALRQLGKDVFRMRCFAGQAMPDTAESIPSAVASLRERLQTGPELGDFIRGGKELSDYSVYAPRPKVRILVHLDNPDNQAETAIGGLKLLHPVHQLCGSSIHSILYCMCRSEQGNRIGLNV